MFSYFFLFEIFVAWECVHRPRFVPKPVEFLSSRYGWVVTNQNVDIALVQSWLVEVQQSIWTSVCHE